MQMCCCTDGEVWIEHGYLYDASDVAAHPMGAAFLQQASIADGELVNTRNVYHSPASVIAGIALRRDI